MTWPLSQPLGWATVAGDECHANGAEAMASMPETMTAIEISAPGGPDVLKPKTLPVPKPGPGQILVKVAAAGVNRPDVAQRMGVYPPPPGHSPLPGLEVAGEVAAIGHGRDALEAGRQGVRAGQRRRLRRVLPRRGADRAADSRRPRYGQGGGRAGDFLHGVEQRVRARPARRRRVAARARRLERHRHDSHPARQGLRRQGHRHGRLRRQVQGVPRARRRQGRQLQGARTSWPPPARPPAARAST